MHHDTTSRVDMSNICFSCSEPYLPASIGTSAVIRSRDLTQSISCWLARMPRVSKGEMGVPGLPISCTISVSSIVVDTTPRRVIVDAYRGTSGGMLHNLSPLSPQPHLSPSLPSLSPPPPLTVSSPRTLLAAINLQHISLVRRPVTESQARPNTFQPPCCSAG